MGNYGVEVSISKRRGPDVVDKVLVENAVKKEISGQ